MLTEIFMTTPDHRVAGRYSYALSDLLTIAHLTPCMPATDVLRHVTAGFHK